MGLIDLHCDTVFYMNWQEKQGKAVSFSDCTVHPEGLRRSQSLLQFFACFIYMESYAGPDKYAAGFRDALAMTDKLREVLLPYASEISVVDSLQ